MEVDAQESGRPQDDWVLDAGLVKDEVLPGGGLLVGRDPLVDQVRHSGPLPYGGSDPICRQTLSAITIGSDWIRGAANPRIAGVHWTRRPHVVKRSFDDRRRTMETNAAPVFSDIEVGLIAIEAGPRSEGARRPLLKLASQQDHTVRGCYSGRT
ncbi:hypothetical protein GCM10010340_03210 [Streptomyces griseoloalbus]|nr:hypothetical protein GCM10010340_03210 [Streptomyces albaduncus]